jgi:F-type H+-transporting ATPase subunit epsilon
MAENKFELQVVTPEGLFFSDDVNMVVFRSTEGDIGVLPGHIPLTAALSSGLFQLKIGEKEQKAVLHGGFAQITADKVTILTDAAEWPEDIDVERAKASKERAEERLGKSSDKEVKIVRAKSSLMRALARIDVADYHSHHTK